MSSFGQGDVGVMKFTRLVWFPRSVMECCGRDLNGGLSLLSTSEHKISRWTLAMSTSSPKIYFHRVLSRNSAPPAGPRMLVRHDTNTVQQPVMQQPVMQQSGLMPAAAPTGASNSMRVYGFGPGVRGVAAQTMQP